MVLLRKVCVALMGLLEEDCLSVALEGAQVEHFCSEGGMCFASHLRLEPAAALVELPICVEEVWLQSCSCSQRLVLGGAEEV